MIVITNPIAVANEIEIIRELFAEGLPLLHIRKPDFSDAETMKFITAIGLEFKDQMVLHKHHHLSEELDISRIHFSEKENSNLERVQKKILSTSIHTIEHFNALSDRFDYAFLSPVFPSISKSGYVSEKNLLKTVDQRTNFEVKLIALGGINPDNIEKALENGFDDVALLGTIWNSLNPIENFKKCQKIALTF